MLRLAFCLLLLSARGLAQPAVEPPAGSEPQGGRPTDTPTGGGTVPGEPVPGEAASESTTTAGTGRPPGPSDPNSAVPAASGDVGALPTDQGVQPADDMGAPSTDQGVRPALAPATDGSAGTATADRGVDAPPSWADEDPLLAADSDEATLGAVDMVAHQRAVLTARLEDARRRSAEVSTFIPAATLSLGVITTAVSVVRGVGSTFACDGPCGSATVAGAGLMGGLAVSTAGGIWLYWTRDDQRELRSEQYHLQRDLRYIDWNTSAVMPLRVAGAF